MAKSVKPIPDGYPTLTPYLTVRGGAQAIAFYKKVFGAEERVRMDGPDGTVGHAELGIGNSLIMLSDEVPGMGNVAPPATQGTSAGFMLYVEDVDTVFARAIAAGATVQQPLENKFYGDRSGTLADPFGHQWILSTHVEDVSPEEMQRRMAQFMPAATTA